MMWQIGDGMGWWMLFGGVWMVVFWGAVIGLIAWVITRITRHGEPGKKDESGKIARERYARGEISHEEYEQIRKDLS